ncbi:hypothetical protein [Accumulibacter sp.]|uniref:hypothetical protein n=1 Tax=Accumulibacter sp. TaxID=2053492 RepID=UPI0025F00C87|nr:hypothetical protein [Accumulibacter sp.]MCM8594441.1 hypothetical protein [Accumulibacter sp.]MCM8624923.1 hypothetical protein [Accumulibacter sp.]MDS4048587.1 hypothetical protein [Accumulibacter sp.]
MRLRDHVSAGLLWGLVATGIAAEQLPPAPVELGTLRRNEQGRIEVVGVPAAERGGSAADGGSKAREGAPGRAGAGQASSPASGRTLVVGPDREISSIREAARLARDGDTIEILPGEYRRQAIVWAQRRLTIRGLGKRPVLIADGESAEGKALWVVRDSDLVIENLEFRGARVAHGNGAGIRFESGRLRVVRCAFFDNEMGILTGNVPESSLEVEDSEFGEAPRFGTVLHHLLYAGTIAHLSVRGSRFEQGYRGHLLKSRARENLIVYNLLVDGPGGSASYELEFPNGGIAWVIGNIIGQSATTDNPDLISYAAEGQRWPDNLLVLAHNTLVNDRPDGRFLNVWTDRVPSGVEVWAINNLLVGDSVFGFAAQAPGRYDGNRTIRPADLVDRAGARYALPQTSALRGTAGAPGFVRERNLVPTAEFAWPVGTRPLVPGKPLSPGALQ